MALLAGETLWEPFVFFEPLQPLYAVHVSASVVFQESVLEWPAVIEAGEALIFIVGAVAGGGEGGSAPLLLS